MVFQETIQSRANLPDPSLVFIYFLGNVDMPNQETISQVLATSMLLNKGT